MGLSGNLNTPFTVNIRLAEDPKGTATVKLTPADPSGVVLGPKSLSFNSSDWSVDKPVSATIKKDVAQTVLAETTTSWGGEDNIRKQTFELTLEDLPLGVFIDESTHLGSGGFYQYMGKVAAPQDVGVNVKFIVTTPFIIRGVAATSAQTTRISSQPNPNDPAGTISSISASGGSVTFVVQPGDVNQFCISINDVPAAITSAGSFDSSCAATVTVRTWAVGDIEANATDTVVAFDEILTAFAVGVFPSNDPSVILDFDGEPTFTPLPVNITSTYWAANAGMNVGCHFAAGNGEVVNVNNSSVQYSITFSPTTGGFTVTGNITYKTSSAPIQNPGFGVGQVVLFDFNGAASPGGSATGQIAFMAANIRFLPV